MHMGRSFGWLWSAYAVSTYGTWIAFGAFPLIAIRVLHSPAFAVSLLEAAGLAVAAIVAFPLGPWVEHRAKRPVMIAMDLIRFLAMASVPIAYALGLLSYAQLLAVSVISGSASIAFAAASGAYLKYLVRSDHLLVANGRFEGTSWVATAAGPPLGGALIGLLGPVITVMADALSYLLSALGVLRIQGGDVAAPRDQATRLRGADLLGGWRFILRDSALRRLFLNSILVSGLIMATVPLLSVLLLGQYHFPAWQYGLAFGLPALGGFVGRTPLCTSRDPLRPAPRHDRVRLAAIALPPRSRVHPSRHPWTSHSDRRREPADYLHGHLQSDLRDGTPATDARGSCRPSPQYLECQLQAPAGCPDGDLGHPRHPHEPARRDHHLRCSPARHPALAARARTHA